MLRLVSVTATQEKNPIRFLLAFKRLDGGTTLRLTGNYKVVVVQCSDQTELFINYIDQLKIVSIVYLDEFLLTKADISYWVPQYNAGFCNWMMITTM